MKSADEEREQRLSLLRGVEEEILAFIFSLEWKDLKEISAITDPESEFQKIIKKISEKTFYSEEKISAIITPPLIAYVYGRGTEEKREKEARRILNNFINFFSWS